MGYWQCAWCGQSNPNTSSTCWKCGAAKFAPAPALPFTVDDLVRRGMPVIDACMVAWDVPPEEFAHYVSERHQPHEWTGNQAVHHTYGESGQQ